MVALRPTGRMLTVSGACIAAAAAGAAASAADALDRGGRHVGAQAAAAPKDTAPKTSAAPKRAVAKRGGGAVYGGVTPQNWPIVIEFDKAAGKVKRIVTGLDMACTSKENFGTTDGFTDVKLNSKNRFRRRTARSGSTPPARRPTSRARSPAGSRRTARR